MRCVMLCELVDEMRDIVRACGFACFLAHFPSILLTSFLLSLSFFTPKRPQAFAEGIREVYEEGDIIWIHGYQLMLLPALIRDILPEGSTRIIESIAKRFHACDRSVLNPSRHTCRHKSINPSIQT